ncbi:MAG: Iron-sulfur assembly protein 1 [Alectoria fallacina]|uniref:Iron-sulfur assembly protein 1 n=1 Tax=Alectoria fallacina TaxID=1903189 RepID=A0A8H3ESI9_9LECA|nr:MAG: Iron-sulfur assembly protein 1 [Alectoria fallacina]
MSLQRCTQSLTSPSYSIFFLRFASTVAVNTKSLGRPSPSTLRYCNHAQYHTRRRLSTATEYHPRSLDSGPPPPRNTNIPDTSIAGLSPEVNNRRPPRLTGQYESSSKSNQPEKQSISITETEAQKSKPVTYTPSMSPSVDKSKRPTKLRPRKAAMSLTPSATEHLQQLLELPEPKLIRVGVKNRGCSGLAYHLEYVDKAGKFDEAVEQDGVKVLIDSKALFSIIGSEMDWVEDKLSQRFVFRNPNIKEQCGCGESFMV